jgi:hypothetical protein
MTDIVSSRFDWLDLLGVSITISLGYNSSHILLLLDNKSLTVVWILHLPPVFSYLSFWILLSYSVFCLLILISSQGQSHFKTGGLQPFSSSWRQAPWDSRPDFFQLNTCGRSPYVTSSLTSGWSVVYNCCWPSPAYLFSGPSPAGLMTTFYCLRFETPRTWRSSPRIYIPQQQGGPVIPPGTGFSFCRLLLLAGLRWRCFEPASTPWRASLLSLDA